LVDFNHPSEQVIQEAAITGGVTSIHNILVSTPPRMSLLAKENYESDFQGTYYPALDTR